MIDYCLRISGMSERFVLTFFGLVLCIQSAIGDEGPHDRASLISWAHKRCSEEELGLFPSSGEIAQMIHEVKELYMLQKGKAFQDIHDDPRPMHLKKEKRTLFSSWARNRSLFNSWVRKLGTLSEWVK